MQTKAQNQVYDRCYHPMTDNTATHLLTLQKGPLEVF